MGNLSLFFGLIATVNNFAATTVTAKPPAPPTAIVMNQDEMKFVDLLNQERAKRGLSQLSVDPLLIQIARKHSREMGEKHYFSHTSPTPSLKTPLERYLADAKRRPAWALVGENLFYCSITGVERGHTALMNSPGHRANILESRYERIGVGSYTTPSGEYYVTQSFLAKTD